MKATDKSFHAWLWRNTYDSYGRYPKNLCPYFWKLIFAFFVIMIPDTILKAPSWLFHAIKKQQENNHTHRGVGGAMYASAAAVTAYLIINFHLLKWALNAYSYNSGLANLAGFINLVIITIGIVSLFSYLRQLYIRNKYKNYNYDEACKKEQAKRLKRENQKPSIIVEFIKATYHKYCPQIEWELHNQQPTVKVSSNYEQ